MPLEQVPSIRDKVSDIYANMQGSVYRSNLNRTDHKSKK